MAKTKKERAVAKRLAEQKRGRYNSGPGPDVITSQAVIEVDDNTRAAKRALSRYPAKKKYVAVADDRHVERIVRELAGTEYGVMDSAGRVRKRASARTTRKYFIQSQSAAQIRKNIGATPGQVRAVRKIVAEVLDAAGRTRSGKRE